MMITKYTMIGIAIVAVLLTSCRMTTMKRYNSAAFGGIDNTLAMMKLSSAKIEPISDKDESKTLWELSGEGQQQLIRSLDLRNIENSEFIESLNNKYLKQEEGPLTIDYTSKELKMIFSLEKLQDYSKLGSISNVNFSTADRIESINFTLTIHDSIPLTFKKWNKYNTEYGAVDVGDLSFSKSLSATAGYGTSSAATNEDRKGSEFEFTDAINAITKTPSISATGAISLTEAQKVKYRYVQLSGIIADKKMQIREEGMREIDLAGNINADVSLKFGELHEIIFNVSSLRDVKGDFSKVSNLKLKTVNVILPALTDVPDSIIGKLKLDYVYRHVYSGAETFYEWDDKVRYYKGSTESSELLFKKADYLPKLFFIGKIGQQSLNMLYKTKFMIKQNNTFAMLRFASLREAEDFRLWLTNYSDVPYGNNRAIKWGINELYIRDNGLDVPVSKNYLIANSPNFLVTKYYE